MVLNMPMLLNSCSMDLGFPHPIHNLASKGLKNVIMQYGTFIKLPTSFSFIELLTGRKNLITCQSSCFSELMINSISVLNIQAIKQAFCVVA